MIQFPDDLPQITLMPENAVVRLDQYYNVAQKDLARSDEFVGMTHTPGHEVCQMFLAEVQLWRQIAERYQNGEDWLPMADKIMERVSKKKDPRYEK